MTAHIQFCRECNKYVDRYHYIYHSEAAYELALENERPIQYSLTGKSWKV